MQSKQNEQAIRDILFKWANATRIDAREDVLSNHAPTAVFFDVLPPLMYNGTTAYEASWDEWQPDLSTDSIFEFTELTVRAGSDKAYAFGIIQCGGLAPDGRRYSDIVRATFCLDRVNTEWIISHQHISMPVGS